MRRAKAWPLGGLANTLAALALLASGSSTARAGNDDGVLLGNEAALTGGAIAAVVRDGSGTWYNPAGLGAVERDAVDVSGNAFQVRAAEEGDLISSTTGASNDGGYLELVSIPSGATIARRLEPGLAVSFGIFAPRFSQHTVRTDLDAGSDTGTARWTLSEAQNRATYHAGAAIGYRVSDELRIGLSLFGVYREIYSTFQTAGELGLADRTLLVARGGIRQVRSFGAELGAGLQWEPHPGVIVALTARSPGLELFTQVRSSETSIEAVVSDVDLDMLSFVPDDEEALAPGLAVLTPGRFNFALAHRFSRGWIGGEIDVQPPLELDALIRRRFVWNVRVGGRYEVDERLGVGFGAFTDHSEGAPIRELGDTRVDFYGVTGGFEYRTPHELGEHEAAQDLVFSTTASLRYALGHGEVGGLRFDPSGGTRGETVAVATTIHEIGIHLGSALYF